VRRVTPAEPDPGPVTDRGGATVRAAIEVLARRGHAILGRAFEGQELESFTKYLSLLQRWQKVHRLVGSVDPAWVVDNLFLDSLLFLRVLPPTARSVADVGSGAGFPGIPIKIVRPELEMALIESRERRISFLSTVVRELGLTGVRMLSGRAESLAGHFAGAFEAVLMRCAGDAGRLLAIAERLVVPGGVIIVSGSPSSRSSALGELVEVRGIAEDRTRRFMVYRGRGQV